MASRRLGWCFVAALAAGCGGGGGDDDGAGGGAGGGGGGGGTPFEGDLAPLASMSESDCRSHFPLAEGVWRYRRKGAEEDTTTGAEVTLKKVDGEEDEYLRETVAVLDVGVGGETKRVRQVIQETFVVEPEMGGVGPRINYKSFNLQERELETQAFVRTSDRSYLPVYQFISDAWATGQFDNNYSSADTRIIRTDQEAGQAEPKDGSYIIDLRVVTSADKKILLIQGKYRENVRQIEVSDDESGFLTRQYWVQPGVGVVQWQFKDSANVQFVLTETNLEPMRERHPSCP